MDAAHPKLVAWDIDRQQFLPDEDVFAVTSEGKLLIAKDSWDFMESPFPEFAGYHPAGEADVKNYIIYVYEGNTIVSHWTVKDGEVR